MNTKKHIALIFAFFICISTSAQTKLRVVVAANFIQTAHELESAFEVLHNIDVEIIAASSGKLTSQILNNAPFDIFFSADMGYPNHLYLSQKCDEPVIYASGGLVFWSKKNIDLPLDAFIKSLPDHSLAIANPNLAPYGKIALEWFNNIVGVQMDNKFVYGENVGQVNQYIYSQSVQAAITATSARYSKELQDIGNWKPVSNKYLIDQAACIIKNTDKFTEASIFLDFVLSSEGQIVLSKFGYLSPN